MVPNEVEAVNKEFWVEFRRRMRRIEPDCYIVGEIWTEAAHYLDGDRFDAVMNYPFRTAAIEFLGKPEGQGIDAEAFDRLLGRLRACYPEPALRVQFNLLGSHDTERLKTAAGGEAQRVKLLMSLAFAYPGAPALYYGDEVGLEGGKDPGCRGTYPWDEARQDRGIRDHVSRLARARAAEPALRRGSFLPLLAEGRQYAFARQPESGEPGRSVVVVLNASSREAAIAVSVSDPWPRACAARDLLGPREAPIRQGRLEARLGPLDAAYFVAEAPGARD